MSSFRSVSLAVSFLLTASTPLHAQTLLGNDASSALLWEFTAAPGGTCPAPNPTFFPCPFTIGMCGLIGPGPGTPPPTGIYGDVAYDSVRDTVFLTDGKLIAEYLGDTPCGSATCAPIDILSIPTVLLGGGFGPITGMGMDELGTGTGGQRTLYITDGVQIAGIVPPPPPCNAAGAGVVYGPCFAPVSPGVQLTDLAYDPLTNSLWSCDNSGTVMNLSLPGCTLLSSFPVTSCGLGPTLQGIAYDTGSGRLFSPGPGALYVTDGFNVEAIDVFGAPAAPTFYAPTPCSPTPAPLNGLAFASRGITYGTNRFAATCGTFGASTTPSFSFGLEYSNAPAGTISVLIINYSFPGPGYLCPPISGLGTNVWVDPSFPGQVINFGPAAPGGCIALPLAIPAGVPTGVNVFFQWLFLNSSFVAVDATEGCSFTIDAP